MEHSFPVAGQTEKGTRLRAANPATMPLMKQREEGQERLLSGRLQDANNALRQELFEAKEKLVLSERLQDANNGLQREVLEAKEKLLVLREEVAAATLSAREHASKRVTAEVRVKTLEVRSKGFESVTTHGTVRAGTPHFSQTPRLRSLRESLHGRGVLLFG